MNQQLVIALKALSENVRQTTFMGRTFRVIPAVLVRSQVLHNNLGRSFLPAEDITPEWAELWNGIPVLVGPHPAENGVPVSGRQPDLWDTRGAGWIFNAQAVQEDPVTRKLTGEVWLDESRAESVEGLQNVLSRVAAGDAVELSTGFGVQVVQQSGEFRGDAFDMILHPINADHLVISTEMTGACSVRDGCGLGVNRQETAPMDSPEETEIEKEKGWKAALARAGERLFGKKVQPSLSWEENLAHALAREFELRNMSPASDHERAQRIRGALQEKFGSRGEVIVQDVYSETKEVVFWLMTPLGSEPQGPEYFRVGFTEEEGGAVNFDEPVKVRRMTVYEPVGNTATQTAGETTSKVVNCGCEKPAASQEEATMSDQNNKDLLASITAAVENAVKPLAERIEALEKAGPNAVLSEMKKHLASLADKVESTATVAASAVQEQERERQSLVTSLAAHYRCPFDASDLEAKPITELRKLAEMAGIGANYSGRGGPRAANAESGRGDVGFLEPVPYFQKDKKEGGK